MNRTLHHAMEHGSVLVSQRRLPWVALVVMMVCLAEQSVSAQGFLPPIVDPGGRSRDVPSLKDTLPPPKPMPMEPAAPTPPAETQERLPPVRVFVREFQFEGHTVVTAQELQAVAAPYTNREVTTEDLESLRTAVTLLYVQRGYVTSGAVIPDQAVTDGLIKMQIIEGVLAEINVEGARWLWPGYYRRRIALGAGPPVNIYTLQERLQLLQQDPRIQRIKV